ncbi:uncharacterized protein LOC117965237 isoform X1 [Acipenser ruthenus]|uniref:uncharacterized protein LOC117965237 isoform X1 n=1 Tax=Acipenser ruthenus TaxID=7906 RepID=UPI002740E35B|nr:uncharacterized protein LOC117965237 isoform X1 [Acipenser ruthenus]
MAGKEKENESLKLRLEISENELKAVRGCINATDADIKQPLIFQDPKESHAIPESEAQEGPKIEADYTQEESFEQECCASLMQVTELACVKDEEVPQQECVPIKEEFIEQECVPIAEELPHENHVCTLEENNKLGSNLYDDSPSECELGFRGNPTKQAALSCLFILQNLVLNTSSVLEIHILTKGSCPTTMSTRTSLCLLLRHLLDVQPLPHLFRMLLDQRCPITLLEAIPLHIEQVQLYKVLLLCLDGHPCVRSLPFPIPGRPFAVVLLPQLYRAAGITCPITG